MKRREIKQYEFVRKIGTGGSGVVYLANDTLLQRPVVLKLLKRGNLTTEQMRVTQLREARLASAIDHPNVCAIYDVGEAPAEDGSGEEAYIVMQYIPGKSLDKLIAEGPASLQLVLSAGTQTADGLSAAHNLGIFHRDLKPANVMLTDGGLIKILDFGLARRLRPDQADFDPTGPTSKRKVAHHRPSPVPPTPRAAAPSPTWRPSSSSPANPPFNPTSSPSASSSTSSPPAATPSIAPMPRNFNPSAPSSSPTHPPSAK